MAELTAETASLVATGIGAAGSLVGGFAQASASRRDAKISDRNAEIAQQQASARQDLIRREARKLKGAQRAAGGASGLTQDSLFDVMEDSAMEAELDALTAGYEGKLQARSYRSAADAQRYDANSSIFAGVTGAAAEALSGYGAWKRIPGET